MKDRQLVLDIAPGVRVVFERSSAHPVEYAITLVVERAGQWHTVRSFDNAHAPEEHHEHHYIGSAKQPPIVTASGSINAAMGEAMTKLLDHWQLMVDEWEQTR